MLNLILKEHNMSSEETTCQSEVVEQPTKPKKIIKIEDNKVKLLSYTHSQTAKNGYKEEELVCKDLNNKIIKEAFTPMLGDDYNECNRIAGNHKCDIQSDNKILKADKSKNIKRDNFNN